MSKRRWLGMAFAAALLLLANAGASGALEHGWARRSLLAHLSASFGRPVEVGRFRVSLLSGLRIEASSVTVDEDPRFGQDYFLRADQLSAGLRWTALLHGRIEFGAVSLTHPSLNLVRLPDGSWNIESWLPPANQLAPGAMTVSASRGTSSSSLVRVATRLSRLDVDTGRINFMLGPDKLPFALVDVTGTLEQDNSGRWSIDLAAHPMRAPVALQDAGTLRLRGTVAGTSARLRPAIFQLSWQEASLADAFRLLDGSDHGVRGMLSAQVSAEIVSPVPSTPAEGSSALWNVQGTVRLSGVHRWDLTESPLDPALNADVSVAWRPGEPRLKVAKFVVTAPHSHVNGGGSLDWSHGFNPSVQLVSSDVGLSDLLVWHRAFSTGLAEDLSVDGAVTLDVSASGWPLHLEHVSAGSDGAMLRTRALPGPIRVGRITASLQRGIVTFGPAPVTLPGRALRDSPRNSPEPLSVGSLQVAGSFGPTHSGDDLRDWRYRLTVSGETQRAQDLVALASAAGHPSSTDWSAEGPAALQLAWAGALHRGSSTVTGSVEVRDLRINTIALNEPLVVGSATVVLKGADRQIRLASVQALGANWSGSLHRASPAAMWDFDLSADRLDVAGLDRWLGPRAQTSFLDRILPFGSSTNLGPARDALFARIAAHGRLRVGELLVAQLRAAKLDAEADVTGRRVVLQRAQADFYGGHLSGKFDAALSSTPSYSFRGRFDHADVGLISDATGSLAGRFGGLAAGDVTVSAHGVGRQSLVASLQGEGIFRLRNAVVSGISLPLSPESDRSRDLGSDPKVLAAAHPDDPDPAESRFGTAAATFHVSAGQIRVDQLLLVGRDEQIEVEGSIDFDQRMDLHVRSAPRDLARPTEADSQDPENDSWAVTGTLEAPQVRPETSVAGARNFSGGAHR